ncbi:MAG: GntR family transcriptional regulator [Planctomycetaceae bacterium]|nr:GntR family transcriptional regulator [Planctomycetaceae bacterium]
MSLMRDPIYQQLNHALREEIAAGKYKAGHQFLTERQIAEQYKVSRATANKALASLVSEGTLEFRKGVGTFVRGGVLDYDLRELVSFTGRATAAGRVPSTQVLEFRPIESHESVDDVRARLQVATLDKLFYLERLRLADDKPMILERRYIVAARCPELTREDVEGSLYAAWTQKHRLNITGAEQTLRATSLSALDAQRLDVRRGAAALRVIALGLIDDMLPLWWENTLYRSDAYEFQTRLGSLNGARSTPGMRMVNVAPEAE